jgi:hypothetical protein
MAGFRQIVARLKVEERKVVNQLNGIRRAIESLEFGSSVSPSAGPAVSRRKRKFSAATRRKMALAQKARWAKRKLKA